jgi:hypothetical protein
MQAWQKSLRIKINRWHLVRYTQRHLGHRAAEVELREAQAWCVSRADLARPKECLRSEELRPPLLLPSRLETVDAVRRRRKTLLGHRHFSSDLAPEVASASGRLIAYNPDFNLACGTSEYETDGYFDVDNTPPWDTWVALLDVPNAQHFETSLIAWVPPVFVSLVQAGIKLIAERCVMWLDECPASLQREWNRVVTTDSEEPQRLLLK